MFMIPGPVSEMIGGEADNPVTDSRTHRPVSGQVARHPLRGCLAPQGEWVLPGRMYRPAVSPATGRLGGPGSVDYQGRTRKKFDPAMHGRDTARSQFTVSSQNHIPLSGLWSSETHCA